MKRFLRPVEIFRFLFATSKSRLPDSIAIASNLRERTESNAKSQLGLDFGLVGFADIVSVSRMIE